MFPAVGVPGWFVVTWTLAQTSWPAADPYLLRIEPATYSGSLQQSRGFSNVQRPSVPLFTHENVSTKQPAAQR